MKKLLYAFFLPFFLIPGEALSQSKTGIPIVETYQLSDLIQQGYVIVDFATASYLYSGSEAITFSDGLDVLCAFGECEPYLRPAPETEPDKKYQFPVVFRVTDSTKAGEYQIQVLEKAGSKDFHIRKLTLLNYIPKLTGFTVDYGNQTTSDYLRIIPDQGLRGNTIRFEGEHWDKTYRSVTIQGRKLNQINGPLYEFGNDWTAAKLRDLELFDPKLEISREHTTTVHPIDLEIRSEKPKILRDRSSNAVEGNTFYTLKLHVQNLFVDSRLELIHDSSFISMPAGIFETTNDLEKGEMTLNLNLKPSVQLNNRQFRVRVHNHDKQVSLPFSIRLKATQNLVGLEPVDKLQPIVQGERIQVKFSKIGAATRSFPGTGKLYFQINGEEPQELRPDRKTYGDPGEAFSAYIDIASECISSAPFAIYQDDSYRWTGSLGSVIQKPSFDTTRLSVFPGNYLKVGIHHGGPIADLLFKVEFKRVERGITFDQKSLKEGIQIAVAQEVSGVSSFDLVIRHQDRIVDTKTIYVEEWPIPEQLVVKPDLSLVRYEKSMTVQTKRGLDPESVQNLKVQVVKKDGTKLSVPVGFRPKGEVYGATINPETIGLDGGERFNLEFTNYSGRPFYVPGYRERKPLKQILVTAGLSAFEWRFKKQEDLIKDGDTTGVSKARLLDGVNLGIYWLPEYLKLNRDTRRALGVGLNLIGQREQDVVKPRVAISAIIYETMVIGFSFGDKNPGLFIGANVSFLDVARVFGGG